MIKGEGKRKLEVQSVTGRERMETSISLRSHFALLIFPLPPLWMSVTQAKLSRAYWKTKQTIFHEVLHSEFWSGQLPAASAKCIKVFLSGLSSKFLHPVHLQIFVHNILAFKEKRKKRQKIRHLIKLPVSLSHNKKQLASKLIHRIGNNLYPCLLHIWIKVSFPYT